MKILIMGLPGAGKTTLAHELKNQLELLNKSVTWLNADMVREQFNDWDFSHDGRMRQAERMSTLASAGKSDFVICDFVAPLKEMRTVFNADYIIWLDTIKKSRYEDTNQVFDNPTKVDMRITEQNAEKWAKICVKLLTSEPNEQISYSI